MMNRAASIVEYTVSPEHAEVLHQRVREHLVPVARQLNGYRGFLLLDRGEGERMALLLFDSVADVEAARQTLTPVGAEHTYALMSGPAIGSIGTAIIEDGIFAQPAKP